MRRQAYEWRALVPGTGSSETLVTTGQVVLPVTGGTIPAIGFRRYYDIMIGGLGNNIEIPGMIRATQFVVIDHIACWPPGAAIQIGDQHHPLFLPNPMRTMEPASTCLASPFPEPNAENILTRPSLMNGLEPIGYVLPGQTWGVEWLLIDDYYNGVGGYSTPTDVSTASQDRLVPRAYVKYLLLDGADALIANDLIGESIPVTPDNIQWYKRMLIRQRLLADSAGRYDSAIENRPQTLG